MRIPVLNHRPIGFGYIEYDFQVVHAAFQAMELKRNGVNPFADEQTLLSVLRDIEEQQIVWERHGIDASRLMEAVGILQSDELHRRKFLGLEPKVEVPIDNKKTEPSEKPTEGKGLMLIFIALIIALIAAFSSKKEKPKAKEKKGLQGMEKVKLDSGTIPVALNGPKKKTIKLTI